MKHTYKLIPITLFCFLVVGCVPQSDISVKNKRLNLRFKDKNGSLEVYPLARKTTHFGPLFLTRHILKTKQGNLLVYEEADIDSDYEFRQTIAETVSVVFESKRVEHIVSIEDIDLYRIVVRDGRRLNLLAKEEGLYKLILLYGPDNTQLKKLLQPFSVTIPDSTTPTLTFSHFSDAVVSKWDVIKIRFYPLVAPLVRPFFGP